MGTIFGTNTETGAHSRPHRHLFCRSSEIIWNRWPCFYLRSEACNSYSKVYRAYLLFPRVDFLKSKYPYPNFPLESNFVQLLSRHECQLQTLLSSALGTESCPNWQNSSSTPFCHWKIPLLAHTWPPPDKFSSSSWVRWPSWYSCVCSIQSPFCLWSRSKGGWTCLKVSGCFQIWCKLLWNSSRARPFHRCTSQIQ